MAKNPCEKENIIDLIKEERYNEMADCYQHIYTNVAKTCYQFFKKSYPEMKNMEDVTKDLAMESIYKAFKDIAKYEGKGTLAGYVWGYCKFLSLNYLRKHRGKIRYISGAKDEDGQEDDPLKHVSSDDEGLKDKIELELRHQILEEARIEIENPCSDVLAKRIDLKQSFQEIALAYDWTDQYAKKNYYKCLKKLKELAKKLLQQAEGNENISFGEA